MRDYTIIKRSHVSVLDYETPVKGMWSKGIHDDNELAIILCPYCGSTISLRRFNIDKDGIVTPSFKCSVCHFDAWIVLEDWK